MLTQCHPMLTHSSILAWKIPWAEEPTVGYNPWGHQKARHSCAHTHPPIYVETHKDRSSFGIAFLPLITNYSLILQAYAIVKNKVFNFHKFLM